ncbi:hypothetical protein PHMEG_0008496 [Phytophthora megakarya]|uniref:Uncharacterized protein n=1 Tax=Phytophthora megakarya TaxID=4795 RepID=A0A225WIV8_9STRA|nr:hypothetical protein PHMEG_0008496 [Phytophthora megakarya]
MQSREDSSAGHEAEELPELREEVSRLLTRCENAERDFVSKTQLRTSAEAALVHANDDFYSVRDSSQVLRAENEDLVDLIMRYVDQGRERMKAGLVVYKAKLSKLHQYLDEHSRKLSKLRQYLDEHSRGKARSSLGVLEEEDTADSCDTESAFRSQEDSATSDSSVDISPPAKKVCSPPAPTLTDECIDNDMGGEAAAEASNEEAKSGTGLNLPVVADVPIPSSAVEVLDLTADDVVTPPNGKASSPFSSPVVSFFPRKDERPLRSTSVASEFRMRGNLEKELADDDFILGLTNEGSAAQVTGPVHVGDAASTTYRDLGQVVSSFSSRTWAHYPERPPPTPPNSGHYDHCDRSAWH